MSATNRGSVRRMADYYPTPENVIINFLNYYKLDDGVILEPCAGDGAFIRALRKVYKNNIIVANEIRKEENDNLIKSGATFVHNEDFLNATFDYEVSTIITNPPYTLAQEFVETALTKYPNATVIMLLRLAFLESRKRFNFWQKYPVNELYVLSKRPSFTGRGTDATAYAWFIWNGKQEQSIKVI